ncbi:LOW QUALITY PROTEIN: DNA repair protein RecN [Liberibacter crescens BT-1]|uniref:DNA repair protein RecN n=1 Tax=Liberibacter crescens (strain BT-1) TaxID=1215343 RepID=L0EUG0_LIBCB|nr:LOW QUALITY PROTEIN: DNA repair protein RecN [Liberibacter crescens BT-1]
MLIHLLIRDIILIENLDLRFSSGLSILSGETGAGKSILLDSLCLALGGRGDGHLVRHGKERGQVIAVFDVEERHPVRNFLNEGGINNEGNVIFRRLQFIDGRTKAYINDQPVSIQFMRTASRFLVENHGQNEDHGLFDLSMHRNLLDIYAGLEVELCSLRKLYDYWKKSESAVVECKKNAIFICRDAEYLRLSVEELQNLAAQEEEETILAEVRANMARTERKLSDLNEIYEEFNRSSSSPITIITSILRRLERKKSDLNSSFDGIISSLDAALEKLETVQMEIETVLSGLEYDPKKLEDIEERLFLLRAASRKYSVSVVELPSLTKKMTADLAYFDDSVDELCRLEKECLSAQTAYYTTAQNISDKRRNAAEAMTKEVMTEFPSLKLEQACFMVEIVSNQENFSPEGIDRVEFYVQTNVGERPGPLMKLASGGELSRVLLALKVVLAHRGSAPTLVFDEIDAGAGGAVADAIGFRLKRLAKNVQVLAITHAPQVAARADTHFLITKTPLSTDHQRMVTHVTTMTEKERCEEVARMLAGTYITEEARAAAARLLKEDI